MLDTYRIRTRLGKLRDKLVILEKSFKGLPLKSFKEDHNLNASAERHLQVAIQTCIDIANHIVASLGLNRPKNETAEAFIAIANEGIIPEKFGNIMVNVGGYRNVLVHGYLDVDIKETYNNINHHLEDLSKFAKYIEEFIEEYEKKNGKSDI